MRKIQMKKSNGLTFIEGIEEYLTDCKLRNLRQATIKHYQDFEKQIVKYIDEDMLIKDMDISTVNNLILKLKSVESIGSNTLAIYVRDLKTLLYYFMRKEYIAPFKIKLPTTDRTPVETYTDNELKRLLKKPKVSVCSFTEYRAWVIVNFILSTGLRRHSLINIKIKDIDFDNKVAHINTTKNRKALIIPLNEDIVKILKEYLKYRDGNSDDYLFCNVYGGKQSNSNIYSTLTEYSKSRGVQQTGLHRYRHTFAKKWVLMGGNIVTLQKILGHSNLAITNNYLNLLVTDIQADVDRFNILREFKQESIKIKK